MANKSKQARWIMRIAFCAVFIINVMCALQFCLTPEQFSAAYQLSGVPGRIAIQGIGVAFLMWNCTYPLVIAKPEKYKNIAFIVIAQQIVGLCGESLILFGLPESGFEVLWSSILRFIIFDAAGLIIMLLSLAYMLAVLKKASK